VVWTSAAEDLWQRIAQDRPLTDAPATPTSTTASQGA
jgi:hypothetical protein